MCFLELRTTRLKSAKMMNRGCLLIFSIITTQLMPFKEALECMMGEYKVNGQCCPTCHPGYRVHETCSLMTGTTCVPCDPGTYTAHRSGLKDCLQCKVCDPAFGLVTRRECSPISNTVCGCSPGYFCTNMKDDDCEMCVAHRVCTPGQYVKSRGTERNNTICEECQAGTFSPNGTLDQCLPWTNCTTQGSFEEKPGTNTTDALCSPKSNLQLTLIGILFIIIIAVIAFIAFIILVVTLVRKTTEKQEGGRTHQNESSSKLMM
ncbi:tumor necrosis factor receptor superfamily member 14-like isoform X2 [Phascolarctos cinereus]|uniref:Tumor necrosis factor receptor superfamily member 14-like isoform X2 n=1 Tax=Phascolarctos cinereus TaxID=38626 RepID=A0A6P5JJN9_PHACI|nr:tumor necrosis factor receptor superfamily member 14-like isoform X2 [Phascolarctos cinereus]